MRKVIKGKISPFKVFAIKILILAVVSCVGAMFLDGKIRPIVQTIANNQTRDNGIQAINDAVTDELISEKIAYSNLVNLGTNENGQIVSLTTDIVNINNLKAKVTNRISQNLKAMADNKILIPIGTLLDWQIFSGWGPNVGFEILPTSFVKTDIGNEFTHAGINQTLHRIILKVNVNVTSVIAGYTISNNINTSFVIAETVIVGIVPEAFTDVIDSESSIPGKIFDYGAEKSLDNVD